MAGAACGSNYWTGLAWALPVSKTHMRDSSNDDSEYHDAMLDLLEWIWGRDLHRPGVSLAGEIPVNGPGHGHHCQRIHRSFSLDECLE